MGRDSLLELPQSSPFPSERFRCTYCDSSEHTITKCPVYDFHNDMGSDVSEDWTRGRDMVLARRKANYFGGIPEMYLKKGAPEQYRIAERYRLEQAEKFRQSAKEIVAKLRKPLKALEEEQGFCEWTPERSRREGYWKAVREREARWAAEREKV